MTKDLTELIDASVENRIRGLEQLKSKPDLLTRTKRLERDSPAFLGRFENYAQGVRIPFAGQWCRVNSADLARHTFASSAALDTRKIVRILLTTWRESEC